MQEDYVRQYLERMNNSFDVFTWSGVSEFSFSISHVAAMLNKNDNLKTVIHMKWDIYLQLNPAHFAPCGFPAVSIPICWLHWYEHGNSSPNFHWTFISIWPQAHSKQREKMKRSRRRQWRSRPLLHLAVNNSPVTLTVSVATLGNTVLCSSCWCW